MIEIRDKKNCCGCEACANICPKKCIKMEEDEEGFLYPKVDKKQCINCGLCEKVCQYKELNLNIIDDDVEVYSCVIKDKEDLKESTTAAVFFNLAKYIIENNGIVYGAKYNDDMQVVHARVDNINGIEKLRGSKYVQSKIGEIYKIVKEDLENNNKVLFSGTPCQVGGLYKYLGKNYENLITVDIVCYGVPSPKIYMDYIKRLERKNHSKVININFRDKTNGWRNRYTKVEFEDKNIKYFIPSEQDEWYSIFISHIATRNSCNNCLYTSLYRKSDITLGDFWGIENIDKNIEDFYGISKVMLNTKKGKKLFKVIEPKYEVKKRKLEDAIRPNLQHPPKVNKNRKKYFEIYQKKGYEKAYCKFVKKTLRRKIKIKIGRIIKGKL